MTRLKGDHVSFGETTSATGQRLGVSARRGCASLPALGAGAAPLPPWVSAASGAQALGEAVSASTALSAWPGLVFPEPTGPRAMCPPSRTPQATAWVKTEVGTCAPMRQRAGDDGCEKK